MADIDILIAPPVDPEIVPSLAQFELWADTVFAKLAIEPATIAVKIVCAEESQQLNTDYRNKDKPTNVLSFPSDLPKEIQGRFLGDLAICADIVIGEAQKQNKPEVAHWAHLFIHGLLHLLGYDHIEEDDAAQMEQLEIDVLSLLKYDNPYLESN